MLAFSLFTMVVDAARGSSAPRWASLRQAVRRCSAGPGATPTSSRSPPAAIAILAVALPVLATARHPDPAGAQRRRARSGAAPGAGRCTAAWPAWSPPPWSPGWRGRGGRSPARYRPIQPYEGGTLSQAPGRSPAAARPRPGSSPGQYGTLVTGWANGDARPTARAPAARTSSWSARRLRRDAAGVPARRRRQRPRRRRRREAPRSRSPGSSRSTSRSRRARATTRRWRSTPPTTPSSYDVAFALVWVDDDSPALNKNEAYAFASCTNCAAVSVGFQVVLVTGDNHVAVPQNISAAVNYDCVNCLTYALATQLFVTLDGPLSDGRPRSRSPRCGRRSPPSAPTSPRCRSRRSGPG